MFVNSKNVEVKMKNYTLEEAMRQVDEISLRKDRDGRSFAVMVMAHGRYINLISVNIDGIEESLIEAIALAADWACRI